MGKIIMATPWADPRTGRLYLRRQIPAALRQSFGGRTLFKKALGTSDAAVARSAFARENALLEERFRAARAELATKPEASDPAALVRRWTTSPAVGRGLDGPQRLLLAFMRLDAEAVAWMDDAYHSSEPPVSPETDWQAVMADRDLFDRMLSQFYVDSVYRVGGSWEAVRMDDSLTELQRDFVAVLVPWLRSFDGQPGGGDDAGLVDALLARLDVDRSGKLEDMRKRAVRAERPRTSRLRPTMRLRELFREWKDGSQPRPQTATEFSAAVDDFVQFAGDPAVVTIDADLLYDYRDAAAGLPAAMPRADRALPFTERVARHEASVPKVSAATLKKRIGAIQALLTYAFEQRWVRDNVGRGVQIVGYTKAARNRRSFKNHELAELFAAPLFTDRGSWAAGEERAADEALFWIFLLAFTSGARLEEVGQAGVGDVREDGEIVYLDIDEQAVDDAAPGKSVKTPDSVRVVPIHRHLLDLGFLRYRDAVAAAGHAALFPALRANDFGKRTKEASRRANRLIDRQVSSDGRLVFHSLRHTFKALGHDAGLGDRTLDQLCGHAPVTTGGRYGSEPRLATIHRELHQIDFGCIDWMSIARAADAERANR